MEKKEQHTLEWKISVSENKGVMTPWSHDWIRPKRIHIKSTRHLLVGNVGQHPGNDLQQENTEQQAQIL